MLIRPPWTALGKVSGGGLWGENRGVLWAKPHIREDLHAISEERAAGDDVPKKEEDFIKIVRENATEQWVGFVSVTIFRASMETS